MLTLTRKIGEKINIGTNVTVCIKEIRRNQVRVGIEAPKEISIVRGEISPKRDNGVAVNDNTASQTITCPHCKDCWDIDRDGIYDGGPASCDACGLEFIILTAEVDHKVYYTTAKFIDHQLTYTTPPHKKNQIE